MKFDFKKDPFENFLESLRHAELEEKKLGLSNYNAMTLATVRDHKPTSRNVLFKGLIRGGFSFYTNYLGRKGLEIADNNNVSAHFYWSYLNQQISIQGQAYKLTTEESDAYFQSRARSSQIGAWASDQSQVLKTRAEFEDKVKFFKNKFKDVVIPRPAHWGGYHIIPYEIEFWFNVENRLHERYVYARENSHDEWNRFMRYP